MLSPYRSRCSVAAPLAEVTTSVAATASGVTENTALTASTSVRRSPERTSTSATRCVAPRRLAGAGDRERRSVTDVVEERRHVPRRRRTSPGSTSSATSWEPSHPATSTSSSTEATVPTAAPQFDGDRSPCCPLGVFPPLECFAGEGPRRNTPTGQTLQGIQRMPWR